MCHKKTIEICTVISQTATENLSFDLWVDWAGGTPKPGQFAMLYTGSPDMILPRPISICEYENGKLRFVYALTGKGTKHLAKLGKGDTIRIMSHLGNGFDLRECPEDRHCLSGDSFALAGGGLGVAPLLETAKRLNKAGHRPEIFLGFADDVLLASDFQKYGNVHIATMSGNAGFKGTVVDLMKDCGLTCKQILTCGPMPMMKAVYGYAEELRIECQVSLEERMACGVGACLGCVADIKTDDGTVKKRICADGPVFSGREVFF